MFEIALSLLLLSVNWGFTPEKNAMYTLESISEQVSRELGRPELVADFNGSDFTPSPTFLRIINAAHKHLDRRISHEDRVMTSRVPVAQGGWTLPIPAGVKYMQRIELEDEAGNVLPNGGMDRRDFSFLRDYYGQNFQLVPQGQPQYWAKMAALNYLLANLSFDAEPNQLVFDSETGLLGPFISDKWSLLEDATWTGTSIVFSKGGAVYVRLSNPLTTPTDLHLTFSEASDLTEFEFEAYAFSFSGDFLPIADITSTVIVVDETVTADGAHTFTLPAGVNLFAIQLFQDAPLELIDASMETPTAMPSLPVPMFSIMPPADKPYTAALYHAQYAKPLADNADVSWWSQNHPEILVLAIKRQIALDLNRNRTEVKEYDDDIEPALFDLETDIAMEEQETRKPEEFRFGWHA